MVIRRGSLLVAPSGALLVGPLLVAPSGALLIAPLVLTLLLPARTSRLVRWRWCDTWTRVLSVCLRRWLHVTPCPPLRPLRGRMRWPPCSMWENV